MPALPTPTALLTSLFTSLPPLPLTAPMSSNPLLSASPSTKSLFLTLHALFPNEFLPALDLLDRGLVTRVLIQQQEEEQERSSHEGAEDRGEGIGGVEDSGLQDEDEASTKTRDRPRPRPRHREKEKEKATAKADAGTAKGRAKNAVYYVHSAATNAQRPGRYQNAGLERKSYEVRLRAWNCSCPAFTFSAFSSTHTPTVNINLNTTNTDTMDSMFAEDGEGRVEDGGEGEEWVFGGLSSLGKAGLETVPVCKHLLACVVGERCGLLAGFVAEKVVGRGEGAGLGAGWGG